MSAFIPGPDARRCSHDGGWTPYLMCRAPVDAMCCFWNEYNGDRWVGYASDMHPFFNVSYLWWKLTGIARIELEGW